MLSQGRFRLFECLLTFLLFRLCATSLDKLAQLHPDRIEHLQEIGFRLPDLAAETSNASQDTLTELQRKAERGTQPRLSCERRARKIGVRGNIANKSRPASAPNPPRQTDSGRKTHRACSFLESVHLKVM